MLADASYVHLLPDVLTDVDAAPLFCPGITAYGSVKKAALSPGQKVAVLGIGGVGHLVVQMAGLTGAEVHAITRGAEHRQVAEELGAVRSYVPTGTGADVLADAAVDAAIVFAPSPDAVAEAMRVVRPGGRIVLGVAETVGPLDVGDEKTVVGSVLGSRWDMRQVLEMAAAGRLRTIVDRYPLRDANAALGDLKAGRIRGRAVVVP
jgi:propanol-preferring alcohol dehydrogenase